MSSSDPCTKIPVALDGSDCALRALSAATHRATEAPETSLHLLSVHAPPDAAGLVDKAVAHERVQRLAAAHCEWILDDAGRRLPTGVLYDKEALERDAAELIARRALELRCDAIFMGAHGSGGARDRDMGSVAARVLDLARPPVRLVK